MDPLSILYIALSVSVLILAIVLSIVMIGIRRNVEHIAARLDETLRQVEMTAEDIRKTNNTFREIVSHMDRAVSNVSHFTEGIRALRTPVDVAKMVLDHSLTPALVGFAEGLAGLKAAASYIFHRYAGKEESK
ncbi:MAG: hypothetical protein AB1346_05500 [Thermodesulfobacteriota bacterium]